MPHARYRNAILKGERTSEIELHLESCDACGRLADAMAAVRMELRDLPLPSAALAEQVLERTQAEHAARPNGRPRAAGTAGLAGAGPVLAYAGPSTICRARSLIVIATMAATVAAAFMLRPVSESKAITPVPFTPACKRDKALWVAGVWDRREHHDFIAVLERFEQTTGVKVKFAYTSHDMAPKLEARLDQHCPPDVALLPQPGLMRQLAQEGHLKPIDKVAGDLVRRNYTGFWRRLGTVGGTLYGVSFKAANKSTIWYDPAALRRVGATRPRTWQQLVELAASLQKSGTTPFSIAGEDGWTLTDWFENVYLLAEGRALYDKLTDHEIPWTHPSVKRALRLLSELFGNPAFLAGGTSGALRTNYRDSVRQVFDKPPKAAMVYEGDFVRSEQPHVAPSSTPEFFQFPAIGRSQRLAVVGGDVAVMLKDNEGARRLVRYLATPAAAKPWASAGGFISPNRNFPLSAYADADTRRTAEALQRGDAIRFDLSDQQPPAFGATAGTGMWEIFRSFLKHPHAINEVARRLEKAAKLAHRPT